MSRAVIVAADRGILGPSTEHLLLALGEHALPVQILAEVGITDIQGLVDAIYPVTRPPIADALIQVRAAQLTANGRSAPRPGPIPPSSNGSPRKLATLSTPGSSTRAVSTTQYVAPAHLLYGVLDARRRRRGGALAVRLGSPARSARPARLSTGDRHIQTGRETHRRRGRAHHRRTSKPSTDHHRPPAHRHPRKPPTSTPARSPACCPTSAKSPPQ